MASALVALFLFVSANVFAQSTTYSYDSLNRLTQVVYADGTTITYTYDAAGNRTSLTVHTLVAQTITWAPTLSVLTTASPLTFAAATTSGDGAISYVVTSAGTTGCAIANAASPVVTFTSAGSCTVAATAAATATYSAATSSLTFAIRAPQTITWNPVLSVLTTDSPLTFAAATTSGDGAVTYAVSNAGTTGCAIANAALPVVTFTSAGSCVIVASAAETAGYGAATSSKTFAVSPPPQSVTWPPSVAASRVYGQNGSFATFFTAPTSATSLNQPWAVAADNSGGIYVVERYNNRVLHYPAGSTTADRVYGQAGSFTSAIANNGGASASSLSDPQGIAVASDGVLYIADTGNHRVLYYPANSTTADRVFGQGGSFATTTSNTGGISATSVNSPIGLAVDLTSGLYVADAGNHRVLHYPPGVTTADRVYGQAAAFSTGTSNKNGVSAASLNSPGQIAVDNADGILVADRDNQRVLHFPVNTTTADRVYGQGGDFTATVVNNGGVSASSLNTPTSVAVDAAGTYIADTQNNRVLHFAATNTTADRVYGQGGAFVTNIPRNGGTSASTLASAGGVALDNNGTLYVADTADHRVLLFAADAEVALTTESPRTLTAALTSGDGAITYAVSNAGTTGCAIADSTAPVVTFTNSGTCTITATAAATANYTVGTSTKSLVVVSPQTITWTPSLALLTTASPVTFSAATSSGDGAITYAVSGAGTTGCAIADPTAPVVAFTGPGDCAIAATAAATATHSSITTTKTFTISLPPQTITWNPTLAVLTTTSPLTFAAATSSDDGAISYAVTDAGTTGCAIANAATPVVTFTGAGSCTVAASASATASFASATSSKTFTVSLATQTVTWNPTLTTSMTASPLTMAAATTSGNGAISYAVSNAGTTGCAIANAATPVVTFTGAGSCTIVASASATASFASAASSKTFTVSLATQTVTWNPTLTTSMTASPLTMAAATTSGNGAISYAVSNAGTTGCAIADAASPVVTFTGAGSCAITATAAATSIYSTATNTKALTISLATQTVTWNPTLAVLTTPATTFAAATTSGDGAITYAVTDAGTTGCAIATASSPVVTFTGTGSCAITATAATTAIYSAATATKTFTVSVATQTVTWNPTLSLHDADSPVTFAAATTSGNGAITYAVSNAGTTGCAIATASSPILTFTGTGSCTVVATAATTTLYSTATSTKTFTVLPPQTLTWTPTLDVLTTASPLTFAAATTSGDGAITYAVSDAGPTGCAIANAAAPVVTFTGAGSCAIAATAAATGTYGTATTTRTFVVTVDTQTITWNPTLAVLTTASPLTFAAATTSGNGAITYGVSSAGTTGCAIAAASSPIVTFTAAGNCAITATAAATAIYSAATSTKTFTISLPPGPTDGTIAINSGALTTTSVNVIAVVSATGATNMSFSLDGSTWGGWQTYATTASVTLTSGDGVKTLYARFRNAGGGISASVSDTIALDTSVSPAPTVSINTASIYTNTTAVQLTIGASPNAAEMQISNDGGFVGASWEPYASHKAWTLATYSAVVTKVVYVRFRDVVGAISAQATDDIILDLTAPVASMTYNGTDGVRFLATDDISGIDKVMVSSTAAFTGGQWETYQAERVWSLPNGATLFAKFRDKAGNISDPIVAGRVVFTDDPLVAGVTIIKAVHVTELRAAINSLRIAHGLAAVAWTDPTIEGGLIRAVHLTEMRAALDAVYQAMSRVLPTYTDPVLTSTTPIRAAHLTELRAAIVAVY